MSSARGWKPNSFCLRGNIACLSALVGGMLVVRTTAVRAAETCTTGVALVVVAKGHVEVVRQQALKPTELGLSGTLCAGDTLLVHQRSHATIVLADETPIRVDQGTRVTVSPATQHDSPVLDVKSGAVYVISRRPKPYRVKTPFVNANVEGTEFLVEARRRSDEVIGDDDCPLEPDTSLDGIPTDRITVYDGRVTAHNLSETVAVTLTSGESAVATATEGPTKTLVVRPKDAVTWTLYVPTILHSESAPRPLIACAGRLLSLGRLDEAKQKLEKALPTDRTKSGPDDSIVYALLATVAVVENEKEKAHQLADLAVNLNPKSVAALIARSYAQQASFQIEDALASVQKADAISNDALTKARLAELQLAAGNVQAALVAAADAKKANPHLARTQSVVGFAHLIRIETGNAKEAFVNAIQIDPADPLPWLGLGLSRIREGDLRGGRQDIEIAAALDTESSLIRSYLGKAYYEEMRDGLAETQLELAKDRDPKDPTPWFYGAILKQSGNRPVEALQDLQKSIELNDNRAVYRSRLLLDQDQAARMVSLARAYRILGFDQLALLESLKSLSLDPSDSSAHRFLADSYSGQIKTEAARVSELLQAQLRQPLGLNSIQPQLLADRQLVVEGAGPVQASGHEFTPLFSRNQVSVKVDGLLGGFHTIGDQLFVSALYDRVGYSVGQYHYETKGLRPNNDSKRDLYSAFVQVGLTPAIRIQAELRDDRTKQGDS